MSHLNGVDGIETYIYDATKDEKTDWMEVAEKYDAIYFNYTANPWGFATMGAFARARGKKLILDLDDSLWNVMPDNPAYKVYQKGSQTLTDFTAICNEVDYVTTTNDYLKHVIMDHTNKGFNQIKIFPNYINLSLWNHIPPFKNDNQITLSHFGSTTHFIDLLEPQFEMGMDKIMKEYPNVKFQTVGSFFAKYRHKWGQRYEQAWGDSDIYKWIKDKMPPFMENIDIVVVPLAENVYTRCKSSIKFLEASSYKKPGVWQDIRQYREVVDGTNGFLASKAKHWYRAIKRLIDDVELRRKMGEEAFKTVESDWQMKDNVQQYADFFHEALDK